VRLHGNELGRRRSLTTIDLRTLFPSSLHIFQYMTIVTAEKRPPALPSRERGPGVAGSSWRRRPGAQPLRTSIAPVAAQTPPSTQMTKKPVAGGVGVACGDPKLPVLPLLPPSRRTCSPPGACSMPTKPSGALVVFDTHAAGGDLLARELGGG